MAHGKLNQPQARRYKDPDLGKTKVAIDMTAAEKEIFKRACKLAGLHQGEFVARAALEWLTLNELRKAYVGKANK
jgi:hypothetical protein